MIDGEKRARNEPKEKGKKTKQKGFLLLLKVFGRSSLDFHPKKKRRAEAKPLSPALCMTAWCCATGPHTLFTRVSSASSLFYTFDILRAGGGGHERLTPPFDCCFTYSVGSAADEERGEVKQALKSVSIRGNMLCFSAAVQLFWLGWQFDDCVQNQTHTHG